MSGYEVAIEEIRKAAAAVTSAGEQAAGVDVAGALSGVAGALPGSRSAQAATGAAKAWEQQEREWSREAKDYGENLRKTADHYATSDQAAQDELWGASSAVEGPMR